MSPRRLALVAVAAAAALAVVAFVLLRHDTERVDLKPFAEGSSATVSYSGSLPRRGTLPGAKGIAIRDGRVYVAVADAAAIRSSGLDGSRVETLALPAAPSGVPAYPVDVAALSDGRLAVVDTAGQRVLMLSRGGGVESTFGASSAGASEDASAAAEMRLAAPTAVTAGAGQVFVADSADHLVKVYRADGTFVRAIGGDLRPRLTFVGGMAYTDGRLYASDSTNTRVVVLGAGGGEQSDTLQQRFDLPRGVAPWLGGVLVADVFGRRVTAFDAEGVPVGAIPEKGSEVTFSAPEDVAFDASSGRAYITDSTLGRVFVFNVRAAEDARGAR